MKQQTINNIFNGIGYFFSLLKPISTTILTTTIFLTISIILGGAFVPLVPYTIVVPIVFGVSGFFAVISLYVSVLYFRSSKLYEWPSIINYWAIEGYVLQDSDIIDSLKKTASGDKYYAGRKYLTDSELNEITQYGLDNLHGPFIHISRREENVVSSSRKVFIFKNKADYVTMKIKFAS